MNNLSTWGQNFVKIEFLDVKKCQNFHFWVQNLAFFRSGSRIDLAHGDIIPYMEVMFGRPSFLPWKPSEVDSVLAMLLCSCQTDVVNVVVVGTRVEVSKNSTSTGRCRDIQVPCVKCDYSISFDWNTAVFCKKITTWISGDYSVGYSEEVEVLCHWSPSVSELRRPNCLTGTRTSGLTCGTVSEIWDSFDKTPDSDRSFPET